jgi:hypothetical protein
LYEVQVKSRPVIEKQKFMPVMFYDEKHNPFPPKESLFKPSLPETTWQSLYRANAMKWGEYVPGVCIANGTRYQYAGLCGEDAPRSIMHGCVTTAVSGFLCSLRRC